MKILTLKVLTFLAIGSALMDGRVFQGPTSWAAEPTTTPLATTPLATTNCSIPSEGPAGRGVHNLRNHAAARSHCLGKASLSGLSSPGAAEPSAATNSSLAKIGSWKEFASSNAIVFGNSVLSEEDGSARNSLAENTLADDAPPWDRFVAPDAFDHVRVSTSRGNGSITKENSTENLRLSINFGSYKGQMNTVSVPTRHLPTKNKNSGRSSEERASQKLSR